MDPYTRIKPQPQDVDVASITVLLASSSQQSKMGPTWAQYGFLLYESPYDLGAQMTHMGFATGLDVRPIWARAYMGHIWERFNHIPAQIGSIFFHLCRLYFYIKSIRNILTLLQKFTYSRKILFFVEFCLMTHQTAQMPLYTLGDILVMLLSVSDH